MGTLMPPSQSRKREKKKKKEKKRTAVTFDCSLRKGGKGGKNRLRLNPRRPGKIRHVPFMAVIRKKKKEEREV